MVCASFVTGSFVVAGVSAFHLWRRQHVEASRVAFSMAMWLALILTPTQILLGDMQGRNTLATSRQARRHGGAVGHHPRRPDDGDRLARHGQQERNLYAIEVPQAREPLSDP